MIISILWVIAMWMIWIIFLGLLANLVWISWGCIRTRWHWMLSTVAIIAYLQPVILWGLPLAGIDPTDTPYILFAFWLPAFLLVLFPLLLNIFLPPLPSHMAILSHPLVIGIAFGLALGVWAPIVAFGLLFWDKVGLSAHVVAIVAIWSGFIGTILLASYFFRAGRQWQHQWQQSRDPLTHLDELLFGQAIWSEKERDTRKYWVIGSENRFYGPVDVATLRCWQQAGRVNLQTKIISEEGQQLTIRQLLGFPG